MSRSVLIVFIFILHFFSAVLFEHGYALGPPVGLENVIIEIICSSSSFRIIKFIVFVHSAPEAQTSD